MVLLETHISWIILAGQAAYKIKKAVNLGFLDFSTLEQRQFYCAEEIRLNRRLAPELYREVVFIGGTLEHPELGKIPALEYAVRMQRFPLNRQLDRLLRRNRLLPAHIDAFALCVAQFHLGAAIAPPESAFGTSVTVMRDLNECFDSIQPVFDTAVDRDTLVKLREVIQQQFAACSTQIDQRHVSGFVRECHGDLHLGNVVLLENRPVPFDAIEFSPALRWIDVMNEIAFTMMDLMHGGREDLAWRFLDAYLVQTGDYAGIGVLRLYLAYRALVRAKVAAIRAGQEEHATSARQQCREYLLLAKHCMHRSQAALLITHGLPGAGKSTFALRAVERLGAIRIRSDVERKRMFAVPVYESSQDYAGVDLYKGDISASVYAHLLGIVKHLLLNDMRVVVDAAFLLHRQREQFRALAKELNVPFVIASIIAEEDEMRERIRLRQERAIDPSEADKAVLEKLISAQDKLMGGEEVDVISFRNGAAGLDGCADSWERLMAAIGTG